MDIYREQILDHFKHPRNFGHLAHKTNSSSLSNSVCGDHITVDILLTGSKGAPVVKDLSFSGVGCAISMACASLLTEKVKGWKSDQVMKLALCDIEKLLGTTLTVSRVKCALLPLEAIQKAIQKNEK